MDLQTRKLNIIQYLIELKDEKLFNKIETIIKDKVGDKKMKPFTQEELLSRAKQANDDYLAGNVKTQEELEIESENW
ncbi:hypothetical protein [Pedobacter glucosidilyticus]|uniref:hypothetical protein n=1 Tax=Pedobacter glucosidilyticus TaxID=1122941 RepID=UPI0026EC05CA|nr:hypothetical protein [Pedobacter glucosidilyticus]